MAQFGLPGATRVCRGCGVEKPLNREHFYEGRGNGRAQCKPCHLQQARLSPQRKTPEQARWWRIRREYGLTPEAFAALVDAQGNRCAICQEMFTDDLTPLVDHCHDRGHVRGLLCFRSTADVEALSDADQDTPPAG